MSRPRAVSRPPDPIPDQPEAAPVTDGHGRVTAIATFTGSTATGGPLYVPKGATFGGPEALRLATAYPQMFRPFLARP